MEGGEGVGRAGPEIRLPRPPPQEGRFSPALDHAHQRGRTAAPAVLQPPHERAPQGRRRDQPQGARRSGRSRSRRVRAARGGRQAGALTMRDLLAALAKLRGRLQEIPQADERRLQDLKTEILGRKAGALTQILGRLPKLDPSSRKEVGAGANALKRDFEAAFAARERELKRAAGGATGLDLTMPGRAVWRGGLHLVTQVVDEICDIFRELGFTRAIGPEAETARYNFFALNFPKDHPALDAQDSFYLGDGVLLRTHTSPVQIRTLERYAPPIRVVIPGQVYRRDPFDASHSPVFEQIEGLAVDEGITFVDFKATLATFARRFFAPDTRVRFRPSFFPFTEPSAEMDVQCQICKGVGCATCKQTGWMETLGSGMVHPAVLENCGVDSERYTGFAWGMGPERIAMTRHGIPDIRLLFESDVRFLAQFAGGAR